MGLPEVFYGLNHFYVANQEHDILLDFNAIDSLSYSGYDKRQQFLNPTTGINYFKEEKGPQVKRHRGKFYSAWYLQKSQKI